MKVLLKKVFMGPMNSARDPLESLKSAGMRLEKKRWNAEAISFQLSKHILN